MDTRTDAVAAAREAGTALPDWLPALLQLASPALPVGAFSYSQGLEAACEHRIVADEGSALAWIDAQWRQAFAVRELPAVDRAWLAADAGDADALRAADREFLASRDCAESRAETLQVGAALQRWLATLHAGSRELALAGAAGPRPSAPTAYALCCLAQGLPREAAVFGWGFAWIENQVQAAVKLVPLGQSAGQRMLLALRPRLRDPLPQQPWSFAPVASILAMRHERQYTRLFRS
jgi:urease accessory protein